MYFALEIFTYVIDLLYLFQGCFLCCTATAVANFIEEIIVGNIKPGLENSTYTFN